MRHPSSRSLSFHIPFTTFQRAFNYNDRVDFFAIVGQPGVNGGELEIPYPKSVEIPFDPNAPGRRGAEDRGAPDPQRPTGEGLRE